MSTEGVIACATYFPLCKHNASIPGVGLCAMRDGIGTEPIELVVYCTILLFYNNMMVHVLHYLHYME